MKRSIWILGLTFLIYAGPSLAVPVIRDGKEWLQPVSFMNVSWNDVVAKCPPPTHACTGTLNFINLSGYTWAAVADINSLFNAYYVLPPFIGATPAQRFTTGSTWAPMVFTSGFFPTYVDQFERHLVGLTSTLLAEPSAHVGWVVDNQDSVNVDVMMTDNFRSVSLRNPQLGAWFFRDVPGSPARSATSVPTMPTYMLLVTILGLIAVASGRLFRKKAREG